MSILTTTVAAPLLLCSAWPAWAQDSFGGPPRPVPARPAPATAPAGTGDPLARLDAEERADAGVPPTAALHAGAMHGPTPASLPGGRLVTTRELVALLKAAEPPLVFDVLGGPEQLPQALYAVPAHQPGSFDDNTQREFGAWLQKTTQGRTDRPLVFYCASTQCWMSYNAALRAVKMGYTRVLWYRGGLQAWKQAGQAVQTQQGGRS